MKTNSFPVSQFLSTASPPELGPGPRAGVRPLAVLNREVEEGLTRAGRAGNRGALVRATILLWHDHLDAAHTIAQSIETTDGSYVHAIMHRREPDYSNAKYWFHRVGQHACFGELAARVVAILKTGDDGKLTEALLPHGQWDSFAFVDACEAVAGRPDPDARVELFRKIQQVEFEVLLEYLCGETAA